MNLYALLIAILGIIAISGYDAIGAWLSRTLKFPYIWLTLGSLFIYGAVALYAARISTTEVGVICACLVALYDSTIGLKISEHFNANIKEEEDEDTNWDITLNTSISMMIVAATIGYLAVWIIG